MRALAAASLLGLVLPAFVAAQPASCEALPIGAAGCAFRAVSLPNPTLDQTLFRFSVELFNPLDGTTRAEPATPRPDSPCPR